MSSSDDDELLELDDELESEELLELEELSLLLLDDEELEDELEDEELEEELDDELELDDDDDWFWTRLLSADQSLY